MPQYMSLLPRKSSPRRPQDAPRRSRTAQETPRTPQDAPKTPPKTPPRRPKTCPKRFQDSSKTVLDPNFDILAHGPMGYPPLPLRFWMDFCSILKGLVNDLPLNFQQINFQRNQKTNSLKVSAVAGSQLCCALDPPRQAEGLRMAYRVPYPKPPAHIPFLLLILPNIPVPKVYIGYIQDIYNPNQSG